MKKFKPINCRNCVHFSKIKYLGNDIHECKVSHLEFSSRMIETEFVSPFGYTKRTREGWPTQCNHFLKAIIAKWGKGRKKNKFMRNLWT